MTSERQRPNSEDRKPAALTSNLAPVSSPSLPPDQNPGDSRPSNDKPGPQQRK